MPTVHTNKPEKKVITMERTVYAIYAKDDGTIIEIYKYYGDIPNRYLSDDFWGIHTQKVTFTIEL